MADGRWSYGTKVVSMISLSLTEAASSILTFPHKRRSLVTVESSHEAPAKCCELHTTLVADMRS